MNKFDINKLVRKNVALMQPYSSARDEFKNYDHQMVFLDANENSFAGSVGRYPDPQQTILKAELTRLKNVCMDTILLGNGSDEVIDLIFRAFCEPGKDNIITLPPTYGMYGVLANLNDIENREVYLTPEFQPNIPLILENIDSNTKIIFLCSPNNPTGNSFKAEYIRELVETFDGLIVLDEAYIDFSESKSWLDEIVDYPNLLIIQTLSKARGMAGLRVGMLFAQAPVIALLNKIKPPYNVNILSQQQGFAGLQKTRQFDTHLELIKESREQLIRQLSEIKFIQKVYPSDANFILIKVDHAGLRYRQLLQMGIVVRDRSSQPLCEDCLRITIGTQQENQTLINALKSL